MTDFGNSEWIQLVKRTREKFGVSLNKAHDLILADEEMRRLVAWRIIMIPNAASRRCGTCAIKVVGRASSATKTASGFAKPA